MNVRTLCLAILQAGEATGYEIRKLSSEGEYSYFVDASFGAIYPALARLEADGLVTVREEAQSGRPSRKIYSITPAGRAELVAQLSAPPAEDVFRSEFLLIAMNAPLLTRAQLAEAVNTRLSQLEAEMAHIEALAARKDNPGLAWITRYGRACIGTQIAFLKENRASLEALGRDADGGTDGGAGAGSTLPAAAE